jgi:hypothetical protein
MAATDRLHGDIIDADKFAWSTDDTLKNSKSPDASYFFGKNIESGSYKCKICQYVPSVSHALCRTLI